MDSASGGEGWLMSEWKTPGQLDSGVGTALCLRKVHHKAGFLEGDSKWTSPQEGY